MSQSTAGETLPKMDPEKTHLLLEQAFPRPLTACFWDPQDRFLCIGSEDNGLQRFDLESKQIVPMVGPHDSWVRAIGVSPDGRVAYSGGYDGRLVWWPTDGDQPEPLRVVDAHQGWIRALVTSPDGRQLATCGNDKAVRLWDSQSGALVQALDGHQFHVYNLAFSPSGDRLVSCDLRGFVKVWDLNRISNLATTELREADGQSAQAAFNDDLLQVEALYKYDKTFRADIGGARCMAFSSDGKRLAIGGVTNVTNAFAGVGEIIVVLINLADRKVEVQWVAKEKVRGTAWGVSEHRDQFWVGLAGGGGGGWLYFWRDDKDEEFFKLKLKNDGRGLALAPDATRVAVAHADRNLRIYGLFAAASSP